MRSRTRQTLKTYSDFITRADEIVNQIEKFQRPERMTEWMNYIQATKVDQGKPHPNMPWDTKCNRRWGYQYDVPGYLGEALTEVALVKYCNIDISDIHPAYDKNTQMYSMIDTVTPNFTVQTKVVRFWGADLQLKMSWSEGEATYTSLVDIDDRVMYIIERQTLRKMGNKKVDMKWLTENAKFYFDLSQDYR